LDDWSLDIPVASINRAIGVNITAQDMVKKLERMSVRASEQKEGTIINVRVPPTRPDILSAADVVEDICISYNYNQIPKTLPIMETTGKPLPINKFADQIRSVVAEAGCLEVLTWALISREENYSKLERKDTKDAITLTNPKTKEFQVVRTNLLSSLLKVIAVSKGVAIPIQIFEVSDISVITPTRDVGAQNSRHLAAVYSGKDSGFEFIHGLLDRVMEVTNCIFVEDSEKKTQKNVYRIAESDDPAFFAARRAKILLNEKQIGVFGMIHPTVLKNFGIIHPTSALELDLEALSEL